MGPGGSHLVLIGATTYRLMRGFVQKGEPGTDVLGGMSKVVFSTTLTEPLAWENSTLVIGDYDDYPDVALQMVDSRTFDGRLQLLEYVPTALAGPPGTATPG